MSISQLVEKEEKGTKRVRRGSLEYGINNLEEEDRYFKVLKDILLYGPKRTRFNIKYSSTFNSYIGGYLMKGLSEIVENLDFYLNKNRAVIFVTNQYRVMIGILNLEVRNKDGLRRVNIYFTLDLEGRILEIDGGAEVR